MDRSAVTQRVWELAEPLALAADLELVDVQYRPEGGRLILRLLLDRPDGGVTLDDCQLVSHQISAYLDVDDVIPSEYELQVSSPGLDRKFYRDSDYQKFLGRLVRVKTSTPIRGLHVIVGRLKEYDGRKIVVSDPAVRKDPDYQIPLADIKETRLEVEI